MLVIQRFFYISPIRVNFMKKYTILIFSVLWSAMLFSQSITEHIVIDWKETVKNQQFSYTMLKDLHFEGHRNIGLSGLLPHYYKEYDLPDNQTISNIRINNRNEESYILDSSDYQNALIDLNDSYLPKVYISYDDHKRKIIIYFPTLKQNPIPYIVDQLISFDLVYDIENTDNYKETQITSFSSQSVMKSGEWHQFKLTKSGVYKMTYNDLKNAGISTNDLISSQIRMYGFGGMIAENNSDFQHSDIPEIAIEMHDDNDGSFDEGDYFLFYAEGPDMWKYNPLLNVFNHQLNIYSRSSYYYLNIGSENGLRIEQISNSTNSNYTVNSFIDYDVKEDETYNLSNSGRRWFGDKYEFTTDYQYEFSFDNLISNTPIWIKTLMVARSEIMSRFNIQVLGQSENVNVPKLPTGNYPPYAMNGETEWTFNNTGSSNTIKIDINYNQPLSGSTGWLDYIEINVERELKFSGGQMSFRNPSTIEPDRISKFIIQNPNSQSINVWDISESTIPAKLELNNSASSQYFTQATDKLKEYIAFNSSNLLSATYVKNIENQNLHAEINHDYIIVTHPDFLKQAEELAQYHRENSHLDVFVTTLQPIYHEYSSGKQDIGAIRNFVKSVHDNSAENKKLKYLLLLGDASMDYLDRVEGNTNFVPTWESYTSLHPIYSVATDDFFAFLSPNEGDDPQNNTVDIGVGRFPVVNATEAQKMIDKIKHYKSNHPKVMSDWRNIICFIADDEDTNTHLKQADQLSALVASIYPTANLDKIYADAYKQESTPAGQRYPKVNEAINERVEKGALIISYTGHGGEVGWGQERFLDVPDILSWKNYDNLPVFLTATCEFARYDDPARVSAGELIFLNEEGGGISLFTTARATFSGTNFTISKHFYRSILKKTDGEYPRMGDVFKECKRATGASLNVSKFILLGDPALKVNMPEYQLNISSIENYNTGVEIDTIKALSKITIKGNISDENNQILTGFNGYVYPTIYDKPTDITTLGNDPSSPPYEFTLQKNILYKGKADVEDGIFEFTFIVPKDIAYKYGNGKISLYAEDLEIDATGYYEDFIIGGYSEGTEEDNQGPKIELYINTPDFQNGGLTNENPVLLAYVSDENGINTTGNGIGHDISAILDGNENSIKILNDYYLADVNTYKSGAIDFPYFNLADGSHNIELKVWDIHNNSSKAAINFVVASSSQMALDQLFNYPNPIIDYTTFSFEHNQSNEKLDIRIDIYSIDGTFVTRIEEVLYADGYRNNEIKWDATDSGGSRIMKGIYIYRMIVKTESGNEAHRSAKLVVIK